MEFARQSERFDDFGSVECKDLCFLNGIVRDISLNGCKVIFDIPVEVDTNREYELHIRFPKLSETPLSLMAQPMRVVSDEQKTEIGFSILHSKDSSRLESYIKSLQEENSAPIVPDESDLFV